MTRRHVRAAFLAVAGLLLGVASFGVGNVLTAEPVASAVQRAGSAQPVTRSVTAVRTFVDADGTRHQVDKSRVSMSVSQTKNLRGRQQLTVRWSGAHPTGGLNADVNSGDAANEEYPFVILQCRGVDSTKVPKAQRIRPETCWTQTWAERFQDGSRSYPAWRSDLHAPEGERAELVNAPAKRPEECSKRPALVERWVPLVAANGTTYPGGAVGCGGMAPESANVEGTGLPSNATYGITNRNGTGNAQFDVWTTDENATLGCTSKVTCSLVAIPVTGISCDGFGRALPTDSRPSATAGATADKTCRAPDTYRPGQLATSGDQANRAVTGALWWSASNWRNRMSVPLSFAPSVDSCPVVDAKTPLAVYGSVLLGEATASWRPKFCTDRDLFPLTHVQTADSAARRLLTGGNVDAVFGSQPVPRVGTRPIVQAPVAFTGWTVSYAIDDAKGRRYDSLRLDARLIAKLLTQSYPAAPIVLESEPELDGNPLNITKDPEFVALNPGLRKYDLVEAAATLSLLSTEADLVYALTSWLDADPEARAWLDGRADPWGMTVNPAYKKVALPVQSWPLLDDHNLPDDYIKSQADPCYSYAPAPYLSLIANPTAFISTIVQNMQYGISNASISCRTSDPSDVSTLRLRPQGRQQPGYRFVLGVVPVSATSRYGLPSAALQTRSTAGQGTFTTSAGRHFARPNSAGLKAAAKLLEADTAARTWTLGYDRFATKPGQDAYPGAMPVFADVPTAKLDAGTAKRAAKLLRYAVGPGQRPGPANGQLPPGYLPLSKANGLGALHDYTLRAADAVAAQQGDIPSLTAPVSRPTPRDTSTPEGADTDGGDAPGGVAGNGPAAAPPAAADLPTPAPASNAAVNGPADGAATTDPALRVRTAGQYSALGGLTLPIALGVLVAAALAIAVLRFPGWRPVVVAGTRRAARRSRHDAARLRRRVATFVRERSR